MIDHLLINLKKYYEGNEKNYIGKTINGVQNSIAAFSYTPSCDKNNSGFNERFERYDSFKSDFLNGIRIIGQATLQNGDILLMIPADYSGGYNQSSFVKLTDILKNGGVQSSPLIHVYRAFLLARKELSMSIEKMLFNLKTWLPQAPGKWYKCEGGDGRGFAWLYHFDSMTSRWGTVYKAGGPNDADTLSKDVAARVDDKNIITYYRRRIVKITECPSRPDVVGEYLDLNDLVKIGGVTSLLSHIRRCLQSLFRNEVIA